MALSTLRQAQGRVHGTMGLKSWSIFPASAAKTANVVMGNEFG